VGIVGENGSGKSTSLKLISRILEPTSGSVSVRGKVSALLELGTGFHPELTGRENIFLNGSLLGISRREMARRYQDIVDFAELSEFIDTPIKHYSSGMTMRLAFAVAINVDPDILLTDEVLAVGDEAFQRKCLDYIADLRRRGVTIIFVSHALDAVRSLCSRAIWLDKGKLVADGPVAEVVDRYLQFENERHARRLREGTGSHAVHQTWESRATDFPAIDEEDDQSAPARASAPAEPPARTQLGSRIRISDVTFAGPEGEGVALALTGQPFAIRLNYEASERLEGPVFGLALYTESGMHLNGPNTRFAGLDIPFVEGRGYVEYRIDPMPLLAGRYYVTAAVTGSDLAEVLDHRHRVASFVVQPTPGLAERWGLLNVPATWSFHPGPADGAEGATGLEPPAQSTSAPLPH
jgi:lipopolysaccharide transport system ATP-binding protein